MYRILIFIALSIGILEAQKALLIPDTLTGKHITLTLKRDSFQFFSTGPITQTMGANGSILGPTLILYQGDSVYFDVVNQLGDTTTLHWHGMHVSAENDGGPHTKIPPGTTWQPAFRVLDDAATYWYHPHLHKQTNKHVSLGIAGMIIVRDSIEATLALPRTYGIDDFPLVVQTKDFDANNQIVVPSNTDDVVMVNATINPYLNVPAQVVRFRLLNGSSQRTFNFGLSNNQTFYQIATDGSLLSAPLALTRLMLSPGERAEILIDFSNIPQGDTLYLMSYASELPNGIYGATNPGMMPFLTLNGYDPNPLNGTDFNILMFIVGPPTSNPVTTIPSALVPVNPIPAANADTTRTLVFTPEVMGPNQLNGKFQINGTFFNMSVINEVIPLNNIEIWELTNQSAMAHPFHIHDVQFYILDRNGNPPPPWEQGKKDVVLVKPQETVRFITQFTDFADDNVPYMYHCHLLTHEDDGMMGQFIVTSNTTSLKTLEDVQIKTYPNPSSDKVTISANAPIKVIKIVNPLGQEVPYQIYNQKNKIILSNLPKGINIAYFKVAGKILTEKISIY